MNYKTLISPAELLPHLEDPTWLVVDCRFDLDQPHGGDATYLKAHIPGALYVGLERDLSAPKTTSNGRHPLPSVEELAALFSRIGVDVGTQVVAYDASGGAFAARFWWSLRYMGHDAVAVLDGGIPAWISSGLPLREGPESRPPVIFRPNPRSAMLVNAAAVRRSLSQPDQLLLDARSPARFRGEDEPWDPVAGRIPGAQNRFWQDNLEEDDRMRPSEALKADFEIALAGTTPENVIAYCGSGVTACHNLLAMEHVGLGGARLYAGSWSEWIADPERPIKID
jgi:thiosulfate/3-mercaptopyruvate sulfurtransferase